MGDPEKTQIADLAVDVYRPSGRPRATVMFCHGFWVGASIWEKFAAHFADLGYVAYAPSWRGRDGSKQIENIGRVSVLDYVEDALAVAREVSPDVLIGESLGGLIAQKAAESLPDLKALILMNPAPPFMVRASLTVARKQLKYLPDLMGKKPNHPEFEDYRSLVLNTLSDSEAREFYKRVIPDSGRALMEVSMGKIKVDANKIRCPVYVVIGEIDPLLPAKIHHRVARIYGADVAQYPAMSHHTFYDEGWENVASEMDAWLTKKLDAARTG